MTTQIGDRLLFEGKWRTLFSNPLEALFRSSFPRPYGILKSQGSVTANHRGYIASWEIRNETLFLVDLGGPLKICRPTEAMAELFDPKGNIRPLCPWCRKPFNPELLGRFRYEAPFFCPHCGSFQHWRTCPNCSRKCDLTAVFCPRCRTRCGTSIGEWQCASCNGTATEWMEFRPPLPPLGYFCIRCGGKVQEVDEKEVVNSQAKFRPDIPPVRATWYSGVLQIPLGKTIEHTHAEYGATYEQDILLTVQEGCVIKKKIRDNRTPELMARLKARQNRNFMDRGKKLVRFFERYPNFAGEKRARKVFKKDPHPRTTPPMRASDLPEIPSGEPWNVPVKGAMRPYLGRQFTPDELYRVDDLGEAAVHFRFVRAFEVLPLIGACMALEDDTKISAAMTALLMRKMPSIPWEGINVPIGPLRRNRIVHTSLPAPVDESTQQPMAIEIYGRVAKVQGISIDSDEGTAWREKRAEALNRFYQNPEIGLPPLNTSLEIEIKAATYANIRYPSIGVPFYM